MATVAVPVAVLVVVIIIVLGSHHGSILIMQLLNAQAKSAPDCLCAPPTFFEKAQLASSVDVSWSKHPAAVVKAVAGPNIALLAKPRDRDLCDCLQTNPDTSPVPSQKAGDYQFHIAEACRDSNGKVPTCKSKA